MSLQPQVDVATDRRRALRDSLPCGLVDRSLRVSLELERPASAVPNRPGDAHASTFVLEPGDPDRLAICQLSLARTPGHLRSLLAEPLPQVVGIDPALRADAIVRNLAAVQHVAHGALAQRQSRRKLRHGVERLVASAGAASHRSRTWLAV